MKKRVMIVILVKVRKVTVRKMVMTVTTDAWREVTGREVTFLQRMYL